MDAPLALFRFLPGEEFICFGCRAMDSSFLHFTDTEHLAAMQGEGFWLKYLNHEDT